MDADKLRVGRILRRREILDILGPSGSVTPSGKILHIPRWKIKSHQQEPNDLASYDSSATSAALDSLINNLDFKHKQLSQIVKNEGTLLPACVVQPEYRSYASKLYPRYHRRDIRYDCVTGSSKEGVPLELEFQIWLINADACMPCNNALIDVCHCDANGDYPFLHEMDPSVGHYVDPEQSFLRGQQLSDQEGKANFLTIVPGWYSGRTAHIHFQVRVPYGRGSAVFVSQLFFDDQFLDKIYRQEPYCKAGERDTRNDNDPIYEPLLRLQLSEGEQGYRARFALGVDLLHCN